MHYFISSTNHLFTSNLLSKSNNTYQFSLTLYRKICVPLIILSFISGSDVHVQLIIYLLNSYSPKPCPQCHITVLEKIIKTTSWYFQILEAEKAFLKSLLIIPLFYYINMNLAHEGIYFQSLASDIIILLILLLHFII